MSDEHRPPRRDPDDFSEYGSLFDDSEATQNLDEVPPPRRAADQAARAARDESDRASSEVASSDGLSFGDSDTGSLPHWTEPPTGELPSLGDVDEHEELDVWSSFSSEAPVWKDEVDEAAPGVDEPVVTRPAGDRTSGQHDRVSGQHDRISGQTRRVTGESMVTTPEPSRITIGTDPAGMPRRAPSRTGRSRSGRERPGGPVASTGGTSGRDMPIAVLVGLVLVALFVVSLRWPPVAAGLIILILGLGAVEFYDKVAEKGYRPAVVPGIVACVAAPLAAYWLGDGTLPLSMSFGFMAIAGSFIGARGVEAGPMPNISITTLGMVWIGLLGSFAMLILRFSTNSGSLLPGADHRGTDTLFLLALGVVANDIGALFVGSAVGRTPLRAWISPNKTVEGLIGGTLLTIIALMLVGITGRSTTWTSYGDLLALALVVSVTAPMGDLVESMFKRNLDVKDFGSIVPGHGGVLDRFDGFLLTLPSVYYLTLVLEPWAA